MKGSSRSRTKYYSNFIKQVRVDLRARQDAREGEGGGRDAETTGAAEREHLGANPEPRSEETWIERKQWRSCIIKDITTWHIIMVNSFCTCPSPIKMNFAVGTENWSVFSRSIYRAEGCERIEFAMKHRYFSRVGKVVVEMASLRMKNPPTVGELARELT